MCYNTSQVNLRGIFMKVIFLDIDGVLNTAETFETLYKRYGSAVVSNIEVDGFRLEYLKRIIDQTGAKLVLTSTFRHYFKKENDKIVPTCLRGKNLYVKFLGYDVELYDTIPMNNNSREEQIQEWLSSRDDVDNFVIIDDDPNLFYELKDKLIQTSKIRRNSLLMNFGDSFGLCEKHIYEIVNSLNTKNKVLKK